MLALDTLPVRAIPPITERRNASYAVPVILGWASTQLIAFVFASVHGWAFGWKLLYAWLGIFSLAGSFIHYVFGLLM